MKTIIITDNKNQELKLEGKESFNIEVGMNSNVKIIDISEGEVKLKVNNDSIVNYISIQNNKESVKTAELLDNAELNWIDCNINGKKSNIITTLQGRNSKCTSLSVIFNDKENQFEGNNQMIHNGQESKSNMLARIVLKDKARANYQGLIKINKNVKGCEGYQKKETILLSKDSVIESDPNLEIGNNEVKCSHGATISQIDKDKLFYMMSRGINKNTAENTIIEGFFEPVLENVEDSIKQEIRSTIMKSLGVSQ